MHQVEEKKGEFLSSWKEELQDEYPWFSALLVGVKEEEFEERRVCSRKWASIMLFVYRGCTLLFWGNNLVFLEPDNFHKAILLDRGFIFYLLVFAFL